MKKHLQHLEDEAISIIRETFSVSENPVVLYSIGKDSSVLLHLFRKSFYPLQVPVKFLHIDTGWKFKEMIKFKHTMFSKYNINGITYMNNDGKNNNINPFDHSNYTDVMKTQALRDALDKYKFDFVYGGARRDEESSRSKEKILSHRNSKNVWDPKNQKIEPWLLFNFLKYSGESFRIFPLSNWTELNIWEYIDEQSIPVVPLYFSKKRRIIKRNGQIFLMDDKRFTLNNNDEVLNLNVRFRTLGCYPLTAGVESEAENPKMIIKELKNAEYSERAGRLIDQDKIGSMELKKREGYF